MPRKGELNHRSTHSNHDVELIRMLKDEGMSQRLIAKKMEMDAYWVSRIINYKGRIDG